MDASTATTARARSATDVADVLAQTLRYARERDYTGWDYADGMSSRLLRALPVEHKWLNIAVQETIKRAPLNVRPLALVEQRRNYKGTALFTMANLNAHELFARGEGAGESGHSAGDRSDVDYQAEARSLASWLVENRCEGYNGYCGSHRHVIQQLDGRRYPSDADVVSTAYGARALLAASGLDPVYGAVAGTAGQFVHDDLSYTEVEAGARIRYATCDGDEYFTHNAIALAGRLYLDLYADAGRERHRERAEALLDYVVAHQADCGGWVYREPPDASHLSMDNHHNGFIVETLQHHATVTGSDRYAEALARGLDFYRTTLFDPDGAPNWDEDSAYPKDVHAAAQGIIVFTASGDLSFARRIVDWTLENLYAGDGRFYFRQQRFYTRPIVLMRWCEAWMAYALSLYALRVAGRTAHRLAPA
mgnify:CR=1 FL=1